MRLYGRTIATTLALISTISLSGCSNEVDETAAKHVDIAGAVTKKGVCVSRYNNGKEADADKIDDLGVSWYYTWGVRSYNENIDAQFVPMIWGKEQAESDDDIAYVKQNYESGKFTHLLTFNEPDLADQSDMTVDEALSYWEKLESIGIPLSSPVVSSYTPNGWLDEFMEKATKKGYRIDFIAVHSYQSFYTTGEVNKLKTDVLDVLYEKYKKPIWLTEFGAVDIIARDANKNTKQVSSSCTAANAKKYIEQATNMLEQCGYVERYSWFLDNFQETGDSRAWEAPYTSLYNDDDTISESGKTYRKVNSVVPLFLNTESLESAAVETEYKQTISVSGGTGDYTFSAKGLPSGLSISKGGTISGKPTSSGVYDITVTISDSGTSGRKQTRTHSFELNVKKNK